ncbi:tartrate-resistant acid phosphatase type 5-like [Ptychodera flava]|uniref:tartrate-resistant acid phosphatase type 5-like n=1 Tax=Ptychodera flava TaxID=63121 RepID=UPI00396A3BFD
MLQYTLLSFLIGISAVSSENALRFTALGDWGGIPIFPYTSPFQIAVADTMGKVANALGSEFTIALGDNFYETGVKDVNDRRFKDTFENVFTAPSLQKPWYVCAGNHDHKGNITAQLAYTKVSQRWNFPELYYSKRFQIPNSGSSLLLVLIDTVILSGNTDDSTPGNELTDVDQEHADSQLKWIEDTLKTSNDDYIIVGGHYPVWSISEHGPNSRMVSQIRPLLEKYDVTAYFCGHDHNLQHLKENNSSVNYFVIGAGDVVDPSTKHKDDVPPGSLKYHWANILGLGGFGYVEATPQNMTLTLYQAINGKDIYKTVLKPRKKGLV